MLFLFCCPCPSSDDYDGEGDDEDDVSSMMMAMMTGRDLFLFCCLCFDTTKKKFWTVTPDPKHTHARVCSKKRNLESGTANMQLRNSDMLVTEFFPMTHRLYNCPTHEHEQELPRSRRGRTQRKLFQKNVQMFDMNHVKLLGG